MRSRTAGALALVLSVATSCRGTSQQGAAEATGPGASAGDAPARGSTAALWALAPEDAAFGLVLADGAGARWREVLAGVDAVVREHPAGARLAARVRARLAADGPFDLLDPGAWSEHGLDLARGVAVFVDSGEEAVLVLPVVDRARFRALADGTADAAEADVDRFGDDTVCVAAADRYLCSEHTDAAGLRALLEPREGPLARRVASLPEELRGDAELVVDLGQFPAAVRELASLRPALAGVQLGVLALRLDRGAADLRGWLQGTRSGPVGAAFAGLPPPSEAFTELGRGAVGAVRVRLPLQAALAMSGTSIPPLPFAGVDVTELFVKRLTGELALYTGGTGPLGAQIAVGVDDTAPIAAALPRLCAEAAKLAGTPIQIEATGCRGTVPLDLGAEARELLPASVELSVEVEEDGLVYRFAGPSAASAPPASAWARSLLDGRWHLALWTRSLDPLATSSAETRQRIAAILGRHLDAEQRGTLDLVRWLLGQVHEAGVAAALRDDGLHLSARIVTYGADPAPARDAYRAALGTLLAGDDDGYRAAMRALAAAHPGTLAGAQATLVDQAAPGLGAGPGLFAALAVPGFAEYLARSRAAGDRGTR